MRGTWQTTSGGSGGAAAAIVIALVLIGSGAVAAVAQALAWIAAVVAVCAVLSVAGALSLMRVHRQQAAEVGAELAQRRQARSDPPRRPIALQAMVQPPPDRRRQLEGSDKRALEPGRQIHLHLHGMSADQIAAVITRSNEEDR
jgi:hypothetical protein